MLEISKLTVMLSCTAHMLNSRESGRERRGQGLGALMGTSNVPSNVSNSMLSLQGVYVVCVESKRRVGERECEV